MHTQSPRSDASPQLPAAGLAVGIASVAAVVSSAAFYRLNPIENTAFAFGMRIRDAYEGVPHPSSGPHRGIARELSFGF